MGHLLRTASTLTLTVALSGCASKGQDNTRNAKAPDMSASQVRAVDRPRMIPIAPPPPPKQTAVPEALRAEARDELRRALASQTPVVRAHAIEATKESLGASGSTGIVAALNDPDPMVRFAAAMSAGELRLPAALPALRSMAEYPNPHVRIGAIFALHRMGDSRHSRYLEEALINPDPLVRANAAFALGRLGERSAIKVLHPVLQDDVPEVRLQASEALWRLGNDDGLRALVAATLSGHPGHQIIGILGLASRRDDRVVGHVRTGLDSEYIELILVTARALGMLGADDAYSPAIDSAKSQEQRHRYLAALALGAIARPDAYPALQPLLKDPDPDVRVAAAGAILQLK